MTVKEWLNRGYRIDTEINALTINKRNVTVYGIGRSLISIFSFPKYIPAFIVILCSPDIVQHTEL